jgi:glycine cleavage system H protein
MNLDELRFSKEHEWLRLSGDGMAVVGITDFAQDSLGDVVFVELPEVGSAVTQFAKMGEIESVKAVSDLYSPVSGSVTGRNEKLIDQPELVNESPYQHGWMLRIELTDSTEVDSLLTAAEYQALVEAEG